MSQPLQPPPKSLPPSPYLIPKPKVHPEKTFWYWLFFPDLLLALLFSFTLYSTPILLNFHGLLTNCRKHANYDGCMAADSNDDTSCIWNATTSTCDFADQFDCSVYSANPVACVSDAGAYCTYRFLTGSSTGPNATLGVCLHKNGWDEDQTGLIASFSVMGGIFGPFVLHICAKLLGFPKTIVLMGIILFISATIFSIAIENGQNFSMYLLSRVLTSIPTFGGAYLYPSILSANSNSAVNHHNEHAAADAAEHEKAELQKLEEDQKKEEENVNHGENSVSASISQVTPSVVASVAHSKSHQPDDQEDDVVKASEAPEAAPAAPATPTDTKKYFIVSNDQKTVHTRVMGTSVGVIGILLSIYLYFVSPDGHDLQQSGLATSALMKFSHFEDFKTKLQVFNIIQFILGVGFCVFAWMLKRYHALEYEDTEEEEDVDENEEQEMEQQTENEKNVSAANPLVKGDASDVAEATSQLDKNASAPAVVENSDVHQPPRNSTEGPEASSVVLRKEESNVPSLTDSSSASSPTNIPVIDQEVIDFLTAPCTPPCGSRNSFLIVVGGVLFPMILQMSGQAPAMNYIPLLMSDVLPNGLLAQVIISAPMPVGALFALFVLSRWFTPLQLYVMGGVLSSFACLCIGLGIYLPTTVDDASYDTTSQGLSIFGLVFFAFVFMAGPGTALFAAMVELFNSFELPAIPSHKEFAKLMTIVANSPEQQQYDLEHNNRGQVSKMISPATSFVHDETNHGESIEAFVQAEANAAAPEGDGPANANATEVTVKPPSPLDILHERHELLHTLHQKQVAVLGLGVTLCGCWSSVLQFLMRYYFPIFTKEIYPDDVRVGRAIAFFSFAAISFLANISLVITQRLRGRGVGAPRSFVKMTDVLCCGVCP